jgi:hypothetical protein
MRSPRFASRTSALAAVIGAHVLALLWLAHLARMPPLGVLTDLGPAMTLIFLSDAPRVPPGEELTQMPGRRVRHAEARPAAPPAPMAAPAPQSASSGYIDWAGEAAGAAARVLDSNGRRAGRRTFATPPPSPAFAPAAARRPGIAWNYAATHRVEALPGGVTVIHLNDHCALAFLIVLPFFGCQIGKIPARGDLFDHMTDPQPPDAGPH